MGGECVLSKTNMDEIVTYPQKVLKLLSQNKTFVSLLTNIPNANIEDADVETEWDFCTNDFNYVEGIIIGTKSFCCIDTEVDVVSDEIKEVIISILIGVHKSCMSLKGLGFTGIMGNRRDNLIRELDYSLRNARDFGIGKVTLNGRISPIDIGSKEFVCKLIEYKVSNFAQSRDIQHV